tara:strand:- start:1559 stop:2884 length:1326 start_codon:yes stop_codon:yes gene_type:complete
MRRSARVTLTLPSLMFERILKATSKAQQKGTFNPQKEDLFYILTELVHLGNIRKKKEFHSLKNEKLKKLLGYKLSAYIKILENEEIIISDRKYIAGKKCFHYKLNLALVNSELIDYQLDVKGKLYKSITKEANRQKKNYNRLEPHLKQMKDLFYKTEFNTTEAKKWARNNLKEGSLLAAISSINNLSNSKTKYFNRNKTNQRLDTNYTCLNKNLRQCIKGNYVNIDLQNSQPVLLSLLLNTINSSTNSDSTLCYKKLKFKPFKLYKNKVVRAVSLIPKDGSISCNEEFIKFKNSCLVGRFYDEFKCDFDDLHRDDVKRLMFAILFSSNKFKNGGGVPYSNEKKVFKSVYPLIYEITKTLKDGDRYGENESYKNLSISLQQLESFIFIDVIAKELCENGIIPLTIHDSFIVSKDEAEEVLKIACNVFKTIFGVVPSFSVEAL